VQLARPTAPGRIASPAVQRGYASALSSENGRAIVLSLTGGAAGIIAGAAATAIYARSKDWATVIPADAWTGGLAAATLIGALAVLLPAIRAARLPPQKPS
jgi:ABC-type antimicrobial peptide transport system permease subunit